MLLKLSNKKWLHIKATAILDIVLFFYLSVFLSVLPLANSWSVYGSIYLGVVKKNPFLMV